MATIVHYTDHHPACNAYPHEIISPTRPAACCFGDMEEFGSPHRRGSGCAAIAGAAPVGSRSGSPSAACRTRSGWRSCAGSFCTCSSATCRRDPPGEAHYRPGSRQELEPGVIAPSTAFIVRIPLTTLHRYLIFAAAGLSLFMYAIDGTAVAVAFPNFIREFETNVLWAAWTISIYMVAVTSMMPLMGNLSDSFGRKPVFLGSLLLFHRRARSPAVWPQHL